MHQESAVSSTTPDRGDDGPDDVVDEIDDRVVETVLGEDRVESDPLSASVDPELHEFPATPTARRTRGPAVRRQIPSGRVRCTRRRRSPSLLLRRFPSNGPDPRRNHAGTARSFRPEE
ncbi:hypothetical protein C486_13852 [Natrinema gari JCM 14663]|uniref:Uncharacterized protein n=1 Tax=Natrinema gari JCM 14663 TaxID=1230459 RepID=L9YUT9_9EURY|nr:hypothetical protein C486_13852 [Natrinema gari JCM 14663]